MAKRVYFAFHYQDVIDFRANVVRNHKMTKGVEKAGYFDASIWEKAKKTSTIALKRMINAELVGTSVTVVLIGSSTWARPWVRYEIFKSIERGNAVFGIHINGITGKDKKTKLPGPNPFDNLCLEVSDDGKSAKPVEWLNGKWAYFSELASFTIPQQPPQLRSKTMRLSHWFPVKDWITDDGFGHFNEWVG